MPITRPPLLDEQPRQSRSAASMPAMDPSAAPETATIEGLKDAVNTLRTQVEGLTNMLAKQQEVGQGS